MRPKFFIILQLLFFSTAGAIFAGCDDTLSFANTAPKGLEINKNKCFLGPDDALMLVGMATDGEEDEIIYSWSADAGTFTPAAGVGQSVTWQAPGGHGTYRIVLRASDGIDDASKGIDVDVGRALDISQADNTIDQTDYPYIARGNLPLAIGPDATVRIEAGVTIVFSEAGGGLEVSGTLVVNGTEEDRVLLSSSACPGESRPWKGVKFLGEQADGTLSSLTMTYTIDGLTVEDGAVVTADDIIVDCPSGDGVTVKSGGNLTLSDSKIWDCHAGIYVVNGILLLQNSSIRGNDNYGILMIENAGPFDVTITGCVIANNAMDGVMLAELANPVINNCSLFWNGSGRGEYRVLYLPKGYINRDRIDMTGNYWGVTTEIEVEQQIIIETDEEVTVDYSGWLPDPPVQD